MIRVYVDDLRKCPRGWTLAKTVTEAIRFLATQSVSEISIDHDISHTVEINGISRPQECLETFEPVARYLALMAETNCSIPEITLHTANAIGAKKMADILGDAGIDCKVKLGAINYDE